jgi:hypothetical protein
MHRLVGLAVEDLQASPDLHQPRQGTHFLDLGEHEIDAFGALVEFPVASRAERAQFDLVQGPVERLECLTCLVARELVERDAPPAREAFVDRLARVRAGFASPVDRDWISSTIWMARW